MSGYTIEWIAVLDKFLAGFINGSGFVMALLLWYGVIHRMGKRKGEGK